MATALRPIAWISAITALAYSEDFSKVTATSAPSSASYNATAAPMPRAAAVTSARLPASAELSVLSIVVYLGSMLDLQGVFLTAPASEGVYRFGGERRRSLGG